MKILSILFIGLFCANTAPAFSSHQNTTNPHTKNKHAQTAQRKSSGVFGKMSKSKSAVSGHTANAALLKKCAALKSHGKPLTKECIAAQKQGKKKPTSAANAKKQPAKKNSMFASMNPFAKKQAAEPAVDDSSMDTDAIMTDDEIDSTGDMNMDDGSMNEEEVDPDADIDDGSMNEEEVDPDADIDDGSMNEEEVDPDADMDDGSMNEEEVDPDAIDDGSMNEEEVDPDAIDEEDSQ